MGPAGCFRTARRRPTPLVAALLLALLLGGGPAGALSESGLEAADQAGPEAADAVAAPPAEPTDELPPDPGEALGAAPPPEDDPLFAAEEDPLLEDDPLFAEGSLFAADGAGEDPFEGWNRGVFRFNRGMDFVLFDPITQTYQFLVPPAGRRAVHRVFLNLDSPVVLANQILQVRVVHAAGTLGRFVINSTLGLAGLFDPAGESIGIERTTGDFGQTLARYGTPSGPYLVLPVFGPSTARDAMGNIVDIMADPISYLLGPFQWWTLVLGGSEGLSWREAHVSDLAQLEEGSVDFYSALRSAYLQSRAAAVRQSRGEGGSGDVVMLTAD